MTALTRFGLLLLAVTLAGCADEPSWTAAPRTHVCNADQMQRVQSEALWCNENTSYLSTYCYSTAILRNCSPRPERAP